jgi:hypothetical protein
MGVLYPLYAYPSNPTVYPELFVWDEVVAFWIVLWLLTPASAWDQLLAFALFR